MPQEPQWCDIDAKLGPLTRYVNLRVAHPPGILLVIDPGMHHGTCVTHVPWCMSGTLLFGGRENVPGIPGACTTRNFRYLARDPCTKHCGLSWRLTQASYSAYSPVLHNYDMIWALYLQLSRYMQYSSNSVILFGHHAGISSPHTISIARGIVGGTIYQYDARTISSYQHY